MNRTKLFLLGALLCYSKALLPIPILHEWDSAGGPVDLDKYSFIFSGYFRTDYNFDSRQWNYSREGFAVSFPTVPIYAADCQDITEKGSAHLISIETRTRFEVKGPRIWCADIYALFENDFSGPAVVDNGTGAQVFNYSIIDGLSVRHAFVKFEWEKTSILVGQFWHPFFPPESPGNDVITLSIAPFEITSRNPQFRVTHLFGKHIELIAAITDQMNFRSNGPTGFSTKYLRDALLPNIHLQSRFHMSNTIVGIAGDYKRLVPRTFTEPYQNGPKYKTEAAVDSFSAMIYAAGRHKERAVWCAKVAYAENLTDMGMICGYAVTSVNPLTGHEEYTPTRAMAFVGEWYYKGRVEPGIVVGFTKNIGTRKQIWASDNPNFKGNDAYVIFGRGSPPVDANGQTALPGIINVAAAVNNTVDYVVGFLPRIKWQVKPITVACELYFSRAVYGTLNHFARADCNPQKPVNVMRFTFSLFYYF